MKVTAFLCCVSLGVASPPSGIKDEFSQWAKAFGKEYESIEEELRRMEIWAENRAMIAAHNAEAAMGLHSFTQKMNALGDLTHAEYKSEMLGLRPSTHKPKSVAASFQSSLSNVPESWDWRLKGIVNAVKNQAQCGSCWAFSAVAAMEGAFNLHSNGTVPSECAGNTCGDSKTPCCSFSEQELVDCTDDGADTCDRGGNPGEGVDEIAKNMNGKANTETQYPYTSGGGRSTGVCKAASKPAGVATGITGYTSVEEGDEDALKVASANNVVSIGIDASQQSFQFYSKGVYVEPKCSSTALDHGVAIVGYGTLGPSPGPTPPSPPTPPAPPSPPSPGPPSPGPIDCIENADEASCTAESGCQWCPDIGGWCSNSPCLGGGNATKASQITASAASGDYWIVRNSWGVSWGLDGYILMARNKDNQCGVASNAIYANVGSVVSEIIV